MFSFHIQDHVMLPKKSFFQILSDPREHKCDIIYENLLRP